MHKYNNTVNKTKRRLLRNNQTDAERLLWNKIRRKQVGGHRFLRQYGVGRYILDFYCLTKRLAIEIDGGQHAEEKISSYDNERAGYLKNK